MTETADTSAEAVRQLIERCKWHAAKHASHDRPCTANCLDAAAAALDALLSRAERAEQERDALADANRMLETAAAHYAQQRDAALAKAERLRRLLRRYRTETPLGHQPHMIAHEVDAALAAQEDSSDA